MKYILFFIATLCGSTLGSGVVPLTTYGAPQETVLPFKPFTFSYNYNIPAPAPAPAPVPLPIAPVPEYGVPAPAPVPEYGVPAPAPPPVFIDTPQIHEEYGPPAVVVPEKPYAFSYEYAIPAPAPVPVPVAPVSEYGVPAPALPPSFIETPKIHEEYGPPAIIAPQPIYGTPNVVIPEKPYEFSYEYSILAPAPVPKYGVPAPAPQQTFIEIPQIHEEYGLPAIIPPSPPHIIIPHTEYGVPSKYKF